MVLVLSKGSLKRVWNCPNDLPRVMVARLFNLKYRPPTTPRRNSGADAQLCLYARNYEIKEYWYPDTQIGLLKSRRSCLSLWVIIKNTLFTLVLKIADVKILGGYRYEE